MLSAIYRINLENLNTMRTFIFFVMLILGMVSTSCNKSENPIESEASEFERPFAFE